MRWLITLLLLLLVAGGGGILLFGDTVLPPLGLRAPAPAESPTTADLGLLQTDKIVKIELTPAGQPTQLFETANGVWTQPGGWELRQEEVAELLAAVSGIRTRFQPLTLTGDGAEFGLAPAQKPLKVAVSTRERTRYLTFGQRPTPAGESAFSRPAFVRIDDLAEVIRVGPDVYATISRSPDVYLRKQLFANAKRARFNEAPTPGQPPLASESRKLLFDDGVKTIAVSGPDGRYTLTRFAPTPVARRDPNGRSAEPAVLPTELAEAWKLTAPTEDRIDPAKLKTILTALPDLWVEKFVDPAPLADSLTDALGIAVPGLAAVRGDDRAALREQVLIDLTGFTREAIEKQKKEIEGGKSAAGVRVYAAERVVTVTPTDGRKAPVVLRIGAVSRVAVRKEMGPPMGMFPGMEREVRTEFRYAKFDGNPRVFEVKADKVADVFVKADDLADPKLAQFAADEVSAVTVTVPRTFAVAAVGGLAALGDKPLSRVTLTRVKGKPSAATEKGKKDRWFLGDRLAEANEVAALVESLAKLEAKSADDRPNAIAPPGIPVIVTVEVEPKVAEGDDPLPKKKYVFTVAGRKVPENAPPFGPPPAAKLAVTVAGWARLNWTELGAAAGPMAPPPGPAADELAIRPVATYRGKQLFDLADCTLDRIAVSADAAAFTAGFPVALGGFFGVAPPPVPTGFDAQLPPADTKWALSAPVATTADGDAAPKLAGDLAELKTIEEVADAPTAEQLAAFGLTKPRLTVTLGFRGTDARTDTLTFGNERADKADVYARRNGTGGVFTVPKAVVDSLIAGAEGLLPKQLWTVAPDKITSLAVKRGTTPDDTYTLTKTDAEAKRWALAGPFAVTADGPQAEALTAAVAALKATKYEPLTVPPARRAKYGLDAPAVRLTVTAEDDKKVTTHTLLVGRKTTTDGTERFAKLDGPNAPVFVIPDAVFAAADKSAVAYLDRKLLSLDVAKVTKIQLTGPTPESAVTLLNDGKGWKPEGAAFPVDEPTVFTLTNAVAKLTALKLAAYGATINTALYGFDKPTHTITLTVAGEPAPVVIQLGKEEPSGERYVRVDGKPAVGVISGFVVSALTKGKLDVIDRGLFTFDPLLVTGVTRKKGTEEFELAPVGRTWEVAKPKKFKADKPMVEALAGEVGFLRATKVAAFAPADLKPFGLDAPAAVVTFKVDGKDQALRVGKPVDDAKPTEDRYAAVVGSQVVAVIPGALATKLLADPVKFSDRTLNPNRFVDADKVVIARDGRTATFAKVDGLWRMTAPAETFAETGELEDLIAVAAQLRADELVANDAPAAQLKELGFDPPQGRIVISNGDKELLALLVGAKEKTGPRVHVKLEKAELIGLLDPATSAKVTAEYRIRAAWPVVDAAQVDALGFSGGGDFALRRKDATTWEDTAAPMTPIDAGKVAETVAVLANLKAERYVADKDAKLALYGLDKPKRVIVLTMKNGDKRVLHLGNPVGGPTGKQVYAKVDDKDRTDVFVLGEADTTKVMGDRKSFGQ